jgi:hypothetical protein
MTRIVRFYCWACMDATRYVLAVGLGAYGTGLAVLLIGWFALTGRLDGAAVEMAFIIAWITGALFGLGMWYVFGRKLRKAIRDAAQKSSASRR